jgi:hypothetical protein
MGGDLLATISVCGTEKKIRAKAAEFSGKHRE